MTAMADRNRHRAPAMQRQITPKRILQRAKGVLTSAGKPILAVQGALQFAAKDSSLDVGTITRTKSLDDGSGTLGGFLRAKAKSLRSKSQDARRNRKDGPHSYSHPPLSTAVSMTSAPSDFEQPTTLVVPVASSSTQHIAEKSSMADVAVPLPLRKGVQMIKVSPGKQKSYKFQLDPDQGQIIWQSKKLRIIPIENIKELRFSSDARYYRQQFQLAQDYEDRWITIIYILNGDYKTLHLIASTNDVFRMWDITLRKLYAIRQELMMGPGNEDIRLAIWEKQYWKASDELSDQKLHFDEVERLCRRLNINTSTEELMRLFKRADAKCRGFLNFSDFQCFVKLLKARPEINLLYRSLCSCKDGKFDFSVFEHFMRDTQKSMLSRTELLQLFTRYAKKLDNETSALDVSLTPLPTSPQASMSPPTRILSPPLSTSPPSDTVLSQPLTVSPPTIDALGTYVTGKLSASSESPELVMSLDGFSSFLLSSDNSAFIDQRGRVWHDMTHPLSDYFVSSSHNTYLTGHQLVGSSTIEGYIRALLHSCRSVELDIYDGDLGPMVFHGKTFTSKVPVREVCEAIAKYAFVTSPYPIVISAEIHCSAPQQEMMVEIMHHVFGDTLVSAPVEGRPKFEALPSPEQLKGRVLLKAKNLYTSESEPVRPKEVSVNAESSSTETSTDSEVIQEIRNEWKKSRAIEIEAMNELKGEVKRARSMFGRVRGGHSRKTSDVAAPSAPSMTPATLMPESPFQPESRTISKDKISLAVASLLVYTVGVKCRGINKKERYAPEHMFSLSEKMANKMIKQGMMELIKHNRSHMVRIYPKGLRVNSSNYLPHRYWAAGAQLVAINWQTFDLGYMINHAMFQRNGRAGYILKPLALRTPHKELLFDRTQHSLNIKVISAQQLPRSKDSLGHEIMDKSMVDPYVEVSVHVPDWAYASYIQSSSPSSPTPSPSPSNSTGRLVSRRTSAVKNNGFNPVWQEALSLPFDCVGGMLDLIFVRFTVRRDGDNDEEPIAVYCVSLGSLAMGYRHLPLHDMQLSQFLFSTLFVKCAIN